MRKLSNDFFVVLACSVFVVVLFNLCLGDRVRTGLDQLIVVFFSVSLLFVPLVFCLPKK
jgi:uncharacterized membrane protein